MASRSLGVLTLDLIARVGGFTAGMNQAERQTDKTTKKLKEEHEKLAKSIDAAWSKAVSAATVASTAAAGALSVFTSRAVSAGAEIARSSELANAGVTEFQRWASASQTVGISQEKLADQLKDFNEKVGEFQQTGGGGMKDFFEQIAPRIDITADAFRNLSGPEALQLYYNSLEKAGLGQKEMSFYLESMASDTTALIPLLRDGGKGLQELGDRAQRLGSILNSETIAASKQLRDDLEQLDKATTGLAAKIAGPGISALAELNKYLLKVSETEGIARASLITFGRVVAGITGSDEFGQLQQRSQAAQDNLKRLTDMAERYQVAIDRGDNVGRNQQSLDKLRQRIASVSQEASAASEALKQFAVAADGSKPSVSAPNTGSGNFLDKYLADRRSDSAKMNAELSAEKVAFESATQGLVKGSTQYTSALEAYNRKAADIRKKFAKGGGSDDPTSKLLDNELKGIERMIAAETSLMADRNRMLDLSNSQGLISIKDYYDVQRAILDESTQAQVKAYDAQVKALQEFQSKADKKTDRADAEGKINELLDKRRKLLQDAGLTGIEMDIKQQESLKDLTRSVEDLNARYQEMKGNLAGAAAIRFDAQNESLRKMLEANNMSGQIKQIEELRQYEMGQASINKVTQDFNRILGDLHLSEQRIALDRETGAVGELEALQKTGEARRARLGLMQQEIDKLSQIGKLTPEQSLAIGQLRQQMAELLASADPIANMINKDLNTAAGSFFRDISSGSKSAKDAVLDLGNTVFQTFNNLVAQRLGENLMKSLFSEIGPGGVGSWFSQNVLGTAKAASTANSQIEGFLSSVLGQGSTSGDGVAAGASASTAALATSAATAAASISALAAAAASATTGLGGQAVTSGGGILDILGGLFGGARANGGPTQAGKFYEVNERGSELFTQGGRTYLMSSGDGRVDPIRGGMGGGFTQQNQFVVQGRIDRSTQNQIADKMRRQTNTAVARLS